jgi:hypothetical protein
MPLQRFLFSQLPSLLLPPYYTAPASQQGLAKLSAPLRRGLWRWLQRSIVQQCDLQEGLLPSMPLQQDLLFYGHAADAEWSSIVQRQQQKGGAHAASATSAATAAAGAAGGIVGASGSTSALSSMQSQLLCLKPGGAATDCSNIGASEDANSSAQQLQGAASGGSKASKKLFCGFLRRRRHASPACSNSSTAIKFPTAADATPVVNAEHQGTSHSSRGKDSSSCSGGSSSSSSSSGCTVVPLFGEIERLGRDCLLLRSGGAVGADVVLYCTGYNRSYEFLDEVLKVGAAVAGWLLRVGLEWLFATQLQFIVNTQLRLQLALCHEHC